MSVIEARGGRVSIRPNRIFSCFDMAKRVPAMDSLITRATVRTVNILWRVVKHTSVMYDSGRGGGRCSSGKPELAPRHPSKVVVF